ncbi:HEAT repeat-containing protein 5A isoform X3 [Syngnathoides biaculeatus]|uniref:HEAT repeat-containing protein 5A isoform X3 n=1 Tax=Syngnathoides biaculeatus TaxID=300417 RepID=UPI002ADE5C6A|nr:HEAT repeat-containing protein 5A isoform X3 [Syngnathoides biaculeatus]
MASVHCLLLNEDACRQLSEHQRAEFIFNWLSRLKKLLPSSDRAIVKQNQRRLVEQLSGVLVGSPGPPARRLLGDCLALLFGLGDPVPCSLLVERCNDIVRIKDDSPSGLPNRLAAVACLGALFEQLGGMMGSLFKDTSAILLKALKHAESQGRYEILVSLERILRGVGAGAASTHRDIYKAARTCLTDRSAAVRCAAARCLLELQREAAFLWTSELENASTLCFRAFEGSDRDARTSVAKLLGSLLAAALEPRTNGAAPRQNARGRSTLEEVTDLLSAGFVRGGAGFLRASGDMLKGSSSVSKEVRVGVTQACVVFVSTMGGAWLEANFASFLSSSMALASDTRTTLTPGDAAVVRRCVSFILRNTAGSLLSEKAQCNAARHLCNIVEMHKHAGDGAAADGKAEAKFSCADVNGSQHVLVCCLLELGALIRGLGSTAAPLLSDGTTGLLDVVVSVLLHPTSSARLAAAWCLRCVATAMPCQRSPLLDRCAERLAALKSCPEAVAGYAAAVAALVAAVQHCPLGIPHAKATAVVDLAEDLLRSASQNSRIALQRSQAGWLLISSVCTLGPAVVDQHLPRLLLLWRCVFPASLREQEMELRRGDYFTWKVTLEGRAGALTAMKKLLLDCEDVLTNDVIAHLLTPVACAVGLLPKLHALVGSYGPSVATWTSVYRLRVYELLAALPPRVYQESFGLVMNQLVSDLLAPENLNRPCSELGFLPSLCHRDDLPLLGPAHSESGHRCIEAQVHAAGGSLENDPFALCDRADEAPVPTPPSATLNSTAIRLFGLLFPHIIAAQRVKILEQFVEALKQLKSQRQQTVQMHVCAALCSLLKDPSASRGSLGPEEARVPALSLLLGALDSSTPALRCAAAEGLARLVQAVGDAAFTVSVSLLCFDRLKSARDAASRSGCALALGALHRYVGGISSPQHLSTCLGVIFTLCQDATSPEVQTWSLHSLSLLTDLSCGLYRAHAEPSLALVLRLLLSAPPTHPDLQRSLGRCLHALITCLGPDLQGEGSGVAAVRSGCLVACGAMQATPHCLVQAHAISCLQRLHMFCPQHVHLAGLVPALCEILLEYSMLANLCSSHLCLRRAVVACLRQLVQREAPEVCELAVTEVKHLQRRDNTRLGVSIKEVGLEGALFALLDQESEPGLRRDIRETLLHMMASGVARGMLGRWLKLCKDVLAASGAAAHDGSAGAEAGREDADEDEDPGGDDDSSAFRARAESAGPFPALRCSTRCFAMECVCRIIARCQKDDPAHFDLALAQDRRRQASTAKDWLVLHLGDVVRVAFMAATDHAERLRLAGLRALLAVIAPFKDVAEPEFPGHVILEQYQANVGAALRPAFGPDAPPNVAAEACQVCSTWLSSGVLTDLREVKRVHQLLASSLAKVQTGSEARGRLYDEATVTMETLAVLKAWAQVYTAAVRMSRREAGLDAVDCSGSGGAGLLALVQSDLPKLSRLWLAALQDYSALMLPREDGDGSRAPAAGGGSFFTAETANQARSHYASSWAPILHATALWLRTTGFLTGDDVPANLSRPVTPNSMGHSASADDAESPEDVNTERLHLILGLSVHFLCSPGSDEQMENITSCLRALQALLDAPWTRAKMAGDQLSVELLSVLHRLLVTRESPCVQAAVSDLLGQIVRATQEHVRERRHSAEADDGASEKETLPEFGEGRDTGGLVPGRSLVFGALEICLSVLLRKLPALSPKLAGTPDAGPGGSVRRLSDADCHLVSSTLCVLSQLPSVCSPQGSVSVLPTILYLLLGVLREIVLQAASQNVKCELPPCPLPEALEESGDGEVGPARVVRALLRALKTASARREKSCGDGVLRSALCALLGMWNAGSNVAEPTVLLTALTVFLLSAGPDVCTAAPSLHALALRRFNDAMDAEDPDVSCRCFQLLSSLFGAQTAVSVPYIRTLGPPLLKFLQRAARRRPQSPEELRAVLEGVAALEVLVLAANQDQRPGLVAILFPTLISFLLDENALNSAPALSRSLHQAALKELMRLGPQHSAVFRSLVSTSPHLKSRLEGALKASQESASHADAVANRAAKPSPSITLKTNFL